MESFIDEIAPSKGLKCSLSECTAGKIFLSVAAVGILASVGSWKSFLAASVYEAVLGLVLAILCRHCRRIWPWFLLIAASVLPILTAISFAIGIPSL